MTSRQAGSHRTHERARAWNTSTNARASASLEPASLPLASLYVASSGCTGTGSAFGPQRQQSTKKRRSLAPLVSSRSRDTGPNSCCWRVVQRAPSCRSYASFARSLRDEDDAVWHKQPHTRQTRLLRWSLPPALCTGFDDGRSSKEVVASRLGERGTPHLHSTVSPPLASYLSLHKTTGRTADRGTYTLTYYEQAHQKVARWAEGGT